jgi:hypothetical protein
MGRPKKNPGERKLIEIKQLRVPMQKLLHNKDIRTAAKNLEDFRLKMKEEEILLGATLTVRRDTYGNDYWLVATRPETDQELADRLEKERLAAEAKKRREAERKAKEEKEKALREERRIAQALDDLKKHAQIHGIPLEKLVDSLKTW